MDDDLKNSRDKEVVAAPSTIPMTGWTRVRKGLRCAARASGVSSVWKACKRGVRAYKKEFARWRRSKWRLEFKTRRELKESGEINQVIPNKGRNPDLPLLGSTKEGGLRRFWEACKRGGRAYKKELKGWGSGKWRLKLPTCEGRKDGNETLRTNTTNNLRGQDAHKGGVDRRGRQSDSGESVAGTSKQGENSTSSPHDLFDSLGSTAPTSVPATASEEEEEEKDLMEFTEVPEVTYL